MQSLNRIILYFFAVIFLNIASFYCGLSIIHAAPNLRPRTYYINAVSGDDTNKGNKDAPFKTIGRVNSISLHAGDSVLFAGTQTFTGPIIIDSNKSGTGTQPIVISSYGKGQAEIISIEKSGLELNNVQYVQLSNFLIKGAGRKEGSVSSGVFINNCSHITITDVDITGFQKAGLLIFASSQIVVDHVHAHENGFAGISIEAPPDSRKSNQILIKDCLADNNPGDPSNLKNHSGNGIVAGHCKKVTIEYCVATNNGWDMPRIGNGPVGIWCYEADSVTIQYCISYSNKTAKGVDDGGGFDLDGGVTNSIIQHCLSYNNQGSGFGLFQYTNAGPWNKNIVRYSISENDGTGSAARAGVYIWNSTNDEDQFTNLLFEYNIIYNAKSTALHFAGDQSKRKDFAFLNNTLIGREEIIKGFVATDHFIGNTWWSLEDGFNQDGVKDFREWIGKTGKEQQGGHITGVNKNPLFKNAGHTALTDPHKINSLVNYRIIKVASKKG